MFNIQKANLDDNHTMKSKVIVASVIFFIAALALRVTYINTANIERSYHADAAKYVNLAYNLSEYGVYSLAEPSYDLLAHGANRPGAAPPPPKQQDTYISPGYPLFLSAILGLTRGGFSVAYRNITLTQAVLSAMTVVLIFLIALECLPFAGALVAGILAVISPHLTTMTGYVLTETLFTFLLFAGLYPGIKGLQSGSYSGFILFGLLMGAASLVRPALLLFPLIFMALAWIGLQSPAKDRLKKCGVMLLGFSLLIGPWLTWKHLNKPEQDTSMAAASFALGIYPDLSFKARGLRVFRGFPNRFDPEWPEMGNDINAAFRILTERAGKEPGKYIRWYLIGKPVTYWSWGIIAGQGGPFMYKVFSSIYDQYRIAAYSLTLSKWLHPVLLAGFCLTLVFLAAGSFGIHQPFCSGPGVQILALLLLYFTFVHTVLAPLPRYSIPLHGGLYILGIGGLLSFFNAIRRKVIPTP